MEYTDKQIEEALSPTVAPQNAEEWDVHYAERRERHIRFGQILVRMVRKEIIQTIQAEVFDAPVNPLPEFWKQDKPEPKAGEWQPIETAPKDGSRVLVGENCSGVICSVIQACYEVDDSCWYAIWEEDYKLDPTHWMPIPSLSEVER